MIPEDLSYAQSFARAHHAEALDLLRTLARIPAPSHHEEKRAAFIHSWMQANGLAGAFIDSALNVICPLHDDGSCELVVFAAHTDIVFPDTGELPFSERDGRLFAPGVGDDTANLVALLLAARHLAHNPQLLPEGLGMLIVADAGEEGLGNLKGTRQLFATYGQRIKRFYSFDLYLPQCIAQAVGSHRWKLTVRTQGGHSFKDYGRPNAIERLCALIEKLYGMPLPTDVPCTVNVGTIEGGTTVNAIAAQASCLFEYRSTSDGVLQDMQARMEAVVESMRSGDVSIEVENMGQRPASRDGLTQGLEAMTRVSCDVIRAVTGEEPVLSAASTDANIPLNLGIPANTIGAVRGALLHTCDEWVDGDSVEDGLAVALGVMLAQQQLPSRAPDSVVCG